MAHVEKRIRNGKTTYRVRYVDPRGKERSEVFARKGDAGKRMIVVEGAKLRNEWVDPALGKTMFDDYADEWSEWVTAKRMQPL